MASFFSCLALGLFLFSTPLSDSAPQLYTGVSPREGSGLPIAPQWPSEVEVACVHMWTPWPASSEMASVGDGPGQSLGVLTEAWGPWVSP